MDTIIRSEPDNQITQSRNKGKLTGAKPPLRPKHVWAVRTRLQLANRLRDLALLAIDNKLRGCDVVGLKGVDVAPHGYAVSPAMRATLSIHELAAIDGEGRAGDPACLGGGEKHHAAGDLLGFA